MTTEETVEPGFELEGERVWLIHVLRSEPGGGDGFYRVTDPGGVIHKFQKLNRVPLTATDPTRWHIESISCDKGEVERVDGGTAITAIRDKVRITWFKPSAPQG